MWLLRENWMRILFALLQGGLRGRERARARGLDLGQRRGTAHSHRQGHDLSFGART